MNKLLLEHDGHEVSKVYLRDEEIPFSGGQNVLLDCQAVNLMHHYSNLQNLFKFSILDYSSLGHRYISIRDLTPINHFLRALGRCLKFKRKYKVALFWNWRMPWESKGWPISSLLWKNEFLDHKLLSSKCTSFLERNSSLFPEFYGLNENSNVVLICPHTDSKFSDFLEDLDLLLQEDPDALCAYTAADRIYVKQHRIAPHSYPATFEFMGRYIEVIANPLTRNLPSEILILGMQNLILFSTLSSVVFAAQGNKVKTLGKIERRDRKDYGLMMSRAKKKWWKLEYSIH